MIARPADDMGHGCGIGQEVGLVARGLDVCKIILRVRPGLEHENAQGRIRRDESPSCYTRGGTTCEEAGENRRAWRG